MCLVILTALMLYAIVVAFFETAQILFPWTFCSTVVAGLVTFGLVTQVAALRAHQTLYAFFLPVVLTVLCGYLSVTLVPPYAPPPQNTDQTDLVKVLFTPPKVPVSNDDIQFMLPIHLLIAGVMGGAITAGVASGMSRKPISRPATKSVPAASLPPVIAQSTRGPEDPKDAEIDRLQQRIAELESEKRKDLKSPE